MNMKKKFRKLPPKATVVGMYEQSVNVAAGL